MHVLECPEWEFMLAQSKKPTRAGKVAGFSARHQRTPRFCTSQSSRQTWVSRTNVLDCGTCAHTRNGPAVTQRWILRVHPHLVLWSFTTKAKQDHRPEALYGIFTLPSYSVRVNRLKQKLLGWAVALGMLTWMVLALFQTMKPRSMGGMPMPPVVQRNPEAPQMQHMPGMEMK